MLANLENSAVTMGLEKVNFHSTPKKGNAEEWWNYCTIALISHTSKVMLKILQARLQQYMNWELPDVQARFRKGRGPRDQIANICWIIKKAQENFKKPSISASLATLKPFTVWITTNCGKFFKRWEYQTTLLASWETCMQVKKQQLELDMEQQTDSKSGKEHIKAVYCHSAYLTSMQSTSLEVPGWMKHKLESGMPGEISITSDMKMTSPLWQKSREELKSLSWRWKKRVKKLA